MNFRWMLASLSASRSNRWRWLWTLVVAASVGCAEDVSIRTYRVAKQQSSDSATMPASTAANQREQLMLGAVVPHDGSAWFFKLVGEPATVEQQAASFRGLVKSVKFDTAGKPSWEMPAGWEQRITPESITYATLNHVETGLKATVTSLPFTSEATAESWRGYVEQNINRWREQVSLPKQPWAQLGDYLEELPELSQGSSTAYFVSLLGRGSGSAGMGPFMMQNSSPAGASPTGTQSSAPRSTSAGVNAGAESTSESETGTTASPPARPIEFTAPAQWQELAVSGMRMAAFSVGAGESGGEVTVIAAGGSIDANIGIWLGQVGIEADEARKQAVLGGAEELSVQDVTAKLYTIESTSVQADAGEPATILVADIPWRDKQSLFVKFKGPASLAKAQRDNFVSFVKSIKWPS